MADPELPPFVHDITAGCRLTVRAHPRARRTGLAGVHAGALRVDVAAPPEGGAANRAVEAVVAEALHVAKRRVTVVAGGASRAKTVEVEGLSAAEAAALILPLVS